MNKKGFTLVELLAVIVILAIVVGITMFTILPTLSGSKKKSFNIAVETIAKYLQDQHDMGIVYSNINGNEYNAAVVEIECTNDSNNPCKDNINNDEDTNLLKTTEYDKNIQEIAWHFENGKVIIDCVTVKTDGDYEQSETYSQCVNSQSSNIKPSVSLLPKPSTSKSKY